MALLAVAVAMALKLPLRSAGGDHDPFVVFLAAVMVSAWYGGAGPGLVATGVAALANAYFFLSPHDSGTVADPHARARLTEFLLEAALVSVLIGALHAARRRAEEGQAHLRIEIEKRQALYEVSEARRRLAEALGAVAHALTEAVDTDVVEQRIVDSVCRLLGALTAAVYRIEPGSEDLVALAVSGDPGPAFRPAIVFPRGTGAAGLAVSTRRPVVVIDVLVDPRVTLTDDVRERITQAPYRAVLAIPLMIQGHVIGALGVGDRAGRKFSSEEVTLVQAFADQAAVALEKARLFAQAHGERRRLEALYNLARRLTATDGRDRILSVIVHDAARLLGAQAATMRLLQGDELELQAQTESAAPLRLRPRIRVGESLSGRAVARDEPIVVEDLSEDPRYDLMHRDGAREAGLHGAVVVPLRAADRMLGSLTIYTTERRRFTRDEVALVTAFADHAAVAIDRARLAREREETEEALRQSEKLAGLGQLVAGVAHELNNPLAVVLGGAELAARKLGADALPHLERIREAGERAANIVRSLLQFARPERPTRQIIEINTLLERVLALTASLLATHAIAVERRLCPRPPTTQGDPGQLQQVFLNLVTNAGHAMRDVEGERTLTVRTQLRGERIQVEIADTGPGIPPALRRRIFEPFFTTKPVGSGTGLGLSVAHGIVAAHDGRIWVEDTAGRGATFVVDLPVRRGELVAARAPEDPVRSNYRVLVVEDETPVAEVLTDLLTHIGCVVLVAHSAAEARENLTHDRFDVVTVDVIMASESGAALWNFLRETMPEVAARVAFITGAIEPGMRTFLESTGRPVLVKPFTLTGLMRLLRDSVPT